MDSRIELDDLLAEVIGIVEPDGDRHTYYNPLPSVEMKYPAIRYSLNDVNLTFANNGAYGTAPSYEVTLIDEEPDTPYLIKILKIPYCKFNRFYIANNLNHWVFIIYKH